METAAQPKQNQKAIFITVIVILLVVISILGYQLSHESNMNDKLMGTNDNLVTVRDSIIGELNGMYMSYDTLSTENEQLMTEMDAQREQVAALLKKAKDNDWSIYKLKKEASSLREIMKGYIVTIDSLNQMNMALTTQNEGLTSDLGLATSENERLQKENSSKDELLTKGAALQSGNETATAIRLKSTGKQVETERASRTQMVKTCFTIYKNELAKSGKRNLFVRIIAPENKVLSEEGLSAEMAGETMEYSDKRAIDYNNEEMDVCVFYTFKNTPIKGDYRVEIYDNYSKIGEAILVLK